MKFKLVTLCCLSGLALGTVAIAEAIKADWFKGDAKWGIGIGHQPSGGKAVFTVTETDGKPAGKLDFDFSGGGSYVVGNHVPANGDFTQVKFAVKSDTKCQLLVRLIDANKECFQYKPKYTTPGEWQTFACDGLKRTETFGGDANSKFDLPVSKVNFGVGIGGVKGLGGAATGTVYFADVELSKAVPGKE